VLLNQTLLVNVSGKCFSL